jgi:hypothetical protein
MTTTTIGRTDMVSERSERVGTRLRVGRIGIGSVAVLAVLVSAWGGIVPYVGPLFGYSATGTDSWHWSLSHSLLGLIPGAVGIVIGLMVLARTRGLTLGRGQLSLTAAGFMMLLCGAWFVVGPTVWPVIVTTHTNYFVVASPMRNFLNQLGYSLGTGLLVATCGAFVVGWAARHGAAEVPLAEPPAGVA